MSRAIDIPEGFALAIDVARLVLQRHCQPSLKDARFVHYSVCPLPPLKLQVPTRFYTIEGKVKHGTHYRIDLKIEQDLEGNWIPVCADIMRDHNFSLPFVYWFKGDETLEQSLLRLPKTLGGTE